MREEVGKDAARGRQSFSMKEEKKEEKKVVSAYFSEYLLNKEMFNLEP